jgi:catechol 2,3-dioxygenase-like lactoylglutathione lyase family enzyme
MIKLHHINIVSHDVPGLDHFYRTALGLERIPDLPLKEIRGYSDGSATAAPSPAIFLSAGDPEELQMHLCAPDQYLGARYGHIVNPISRGHIAYRCDDIDAIKRRLEAADIPYSDWGTWAVKGWHQIFFFDPVGTVVEVHQVIS